MHVSYVLRCRYFFNCQNILSNAHMSMLVHYFYLMNTNFTKCPGPIHIYFINCKFKLSPLQKIQIKFQILDTGKHFRQKSYNIRKATIYNIKSRHIITIPNLLVLQNQPWIVWKTRLFTFANIGACAHSPRNHGVSAGLLSPCVGPTRPPSKIMVRGLRGQLIR